MVEGVYFVQIKLHNTLDQLLLPSYLCSLISESQKGKTTCARFDTTDMSQNTRAF